MPVTAVIGGTYGDEGKGAHIDRLALLFDVIIRATGGNNAGHTVQNADGLFPLHLTPCGIFNRAALCILGTGTVVDPGVLVAEHEMLREAGISLANFRLSRRAHLLLPYHRVEDWLQERRRGSDKIGTTGRGIGPCYADKVSRNGLRVADLLVPGRWLRDQVTARHEQRVAALGPEYESLLKHSLHLDLPTMLDQLERQAALLAPYIADTDRLAREAWRSGSNILLEGAQGTYLDIDQGGYPYVTSSSTTAAGACLGSGLPPLALTEVDLVLKAYLTRVGQGLMLTEQTGETGDFLQREGNEVGTTTGRKRRCGWFDAPLARLSAETNGATKVTLTKLDVLTGLPIIEVCTGYRKNNRPFDGVPDSPSDYDGLMPVYDRLPGWTESIKGVTEWDDLPMAAQNYVVFLEDQIGVRITSIGTGPHRDHVIAR